MPASTLQYSEVPGRAAKVLENSFPNEELIAKRDAEFSDVAQGLARIEALAVLAALATHVSGFELLGRERARNNVIRAFSSVRVRVTPVGEA